MCGLAPSTQTRARDHETAARCTNTSHALARCARTLALNVTISKNKIKQLLQYNSFPTWYWLRFETRGAQTRHHLYTNYNTTILLAFTCTKPVQQYTMSPICFDPSSCPPRAAACPAAGGRDLRPPRRCPAASCEWCRAAAAPAGRTSGRSRRTSAMAERSRCAPVVGGGGGLIDKICNSNHTSVACCFGPY